MKIFFALLSLAATPSHAATLLCLPQSASVPHWELRLNTDNASATLLGNGSARNFTLAEAQEGGVYRYHADGLRVSFDASQSVPARNPFPAGVGAGPLAANAELLTLADGRTQNDLALACVRLVDSLPAATMGEMIQLMNQEEATTPSVAPGTFGDAIQSIAYVAPGRSERPSTVFRKGPPCPTAPGSTVCLPHGFGAPRSR